MEEPFWGDIKTTCNHPWEVYMEFSTSMCDTIPGVVDAMTFNTTRRLRKFFGIDYINDLKKYKRAAIGGVIAREAILMSTTGAVGKLAMLKKMELANKLIVPGVKYYRRINKAKQIKIIE